MTQYRANYNDMTEFQQWLLASCISTAQVSEIIEATPEDKKYVLGITINGVEIDTERFLVRLQQVFHSGVESDARELANKKFKAMYAQVDEIADVVRQFEGTLREKYDLQRDSWDY